MMMWKIVGVLKVSVLYIYIDNNNNNNNKGNFIIQDQPDFHAITLSPFPFKVVVLNIIVIEKIKLCVFHWLIHLCI